MPSSDDELLDNPVDNDIGAFHVEVEKGLGPVVVLHEDGGLFCLCAERQSGVDTVIRSTHRLYCRASAIPIVEVSHASGGLPLQHLVDALRDHVMMRRRICKPDHENDIELRRHPRMW